MSIFAQGIRAFWTTTSSYINFSNVMGSKNIERGYRLASTLTDPVCEVHKNYIINHLMSSINPPQSLIEQIVRKSKFVMGMTKHILAASVQTVPAITLRWFMVQMQEEPFLMSKDDIPAKVLPDDDTFSLLSWNVCCTAAGYSISDGGVLPWSDRIDQIIDKIIKQDADVNCLCEVFDTNCAFYLREQLKAKGYSHIYFNIGSQAVGVSSGILVASKYEIKKPEFTLFPQSSLVGRTKYAAKGVFAFDLHSKGKSFARIFSTHLQHSEQPQYPTYEEASARAQQLKIIMEKIKQVKDQCVIVTGDLNLDDIEFATFTDWNERFIKNEVFKSQKTWGGDGFCARMVGKKPSNPLNLDYTLLLKNSGQSIETFHVETNFDGTEFRKEALSDHLGLYSQIKLLKK